LPPEAQKQGRIAAERNPVGHSVWKAEDIMREFGKGLAQA